MNPDVLHAIFYWILPLSIALGAFFIFLHMAHISYEKADVDRIWKKALRIGIVLGIISIIYVGLTKPPAMQTFWSEIGKWINKTLSADVIAKMNKTLAESIEKTLNFFKTWVPVYIRAFILIWVPCALIWIQSLIWRLKFSRAVNIVLRVIGLYPYLCFKYLLGYQTPFFDYIQGLLYMAKVKENISDSFFDALQGYDDTGKAFDNGQGGTERNQKIKAAALAIRQTKAKVKTANGVRHAELVIRNSRETATDQVIEQQLKGLGLRLSAPSIRFQEDPILNMGQGGYVFDSDVQYNPSDELGSWRAIFVNPFSEENKVSNGGEGAKAAILGMYKGIFNYFIHLTPAAIYERLKAVAKRKYTPDLSATRAKYVAQQNLDLSVIPEPVDQDTGATIEMLKEQAVKVANNRVAELTDALTRYKLNVSFNGVEVGGNTAVYRYTLSRSAHIPNDWKKIQEGLANLLKTQDIPIIRTQQGELIVTMVNGVNIPVNFKEMIEKRPKGMPGIISGIAGVDAMGNLIDFNLGDKNPHAMLFGKTGTGKTVLIMNIIYSIMSATDPDHLKIIFIDGKGNSFEFMRTDNSDAPFYHPNPYVYAQPADGSGDLDYTRALIHHIVKECRRRIDIFKNKGVSKLAEYNKKFPEEALPELLVVFDEFSAVTDSDATLKASELATKGVTDAIEYLAKMARSTGIRLLLANQTARKEKVPGRITANITGRVSLGVTEPIESDIALPDSGIAVHLIRQPGEFYSTMHGARNAEHGNTPYLTDDTLYALNDSLEKKFGHHDYVITREEIIKEFEKDTGDGAGEENDVQESKVSYPIPDPVPTLNTPVKELLEVIKKYPEWVAANPKRLIFTQNKQIYDYPPVKSKKLRARLDEAVKEAVNQARLLREADSAKTRKASGNSVVGMTKKIAKGRDGGDI